VNTPDLTSYRLIHRTIRRSTARLSAAMGGVAEADRFHRGRHLAQWYAGLAGELHIHHTVEDELFFPALFERVPSLRGLLARIDEEHHHLEELIAATGDSIAAIADPTVAFDVAIAAASDRSTELHALMDGHLDFEDAEILPLFTRHMDAADYAEVEGKALATPKLGELRFTVPWMMANADADEQRQLLEGAPFMMKVLWIATRRGHDRLTNAAFGASGATPISAVA
jgi:hypothetical protein